MGYDCWSTWYCKFLDVTHWGNTQLKQRIPIGCTHSTLFHQQSELWNLFQKGVEWLEQNWEPLELFFSVLWYIRTNLINLIISFASFAEASAAQWHTQKWHHLHVELQQYIFSQAHRKMTAVSSWTKNLPTYFKNNYYCLPKCFTSVLDLGYCLFSYRCQVSIHFVIM